MLQVEVLLDEQDRLVLHPTREEFLDQLEGLQSDTTDVAKSLQRLLVAPQLQVSQHMFKCLANAGTIGFWSDCTVCSEPACF